MTPAAQEQRLYKYMSEPPLNNNDPAADSHGDTPKITVVTVTYNAAGLIGRTIESVEQQDYPCVEHLIVDGNSQDDTLAHVHHYQERNSVAGVRHEVACLSEPDDGLYDAMNKALDMATGQYVLFINAGDRLHAPDTLSLLARAAAAHHGDLPAVVYGHTDIVDGEGRFLHPRRLAPPERLTWRSFAAGMLVCHQAFMARTDLARQAGYDRRYRYSADFDWCIRVMREAKRRRLPLTNAHIVVADYLSEGMTTRHHTASLRERFRIMARHYGLALTLAQHGRFLLRAAGRRIKR